MRAMEKLKSIGEPNQREAIGEKFRDEGKKLIGYFCNYVPEEIITAAGAIPYRILGGTSSTTTKAEACVPPTDCSFCRSWLDVTLGGGYDFLAGIVSTNGCANRIRTFDAWRHFVSKEDQFSYVLSVSRKEDKTAIAWFKTQIDNFRENIEGYFGVKVDEEAIRMAIKDHNKTRQYLKELYHWRNTGLISAKYALLVLEASMLLPKAQFNVLFAQAKEELSCSNGLKEGPRILISGSMCSNYDFFNMVEESGCNIVADDLCVGSRYFWELVNEDIEDSLEALARRYLLQPPCARQADVNRRVDFLLKLIREFNVDGVIYSPLKNCDLWLTQGPTIQRKLEKEGLPVLYLEREHVMTGLGQAKTRIDAFLETII